MKNVVLFYFFILDRKWKTIPIEFLKIMTIYIRTTVHGLYDTFFENNVL